MKPEFQAEYNEYQTPTFKAFARWKDEGKPGFRRFFALMREEEKIEQEGRAGST